MPSEEESDSKSDNTTSDNANSGGNSSNSSSSDEYMSAEEFAEVTGLSVDEITYVDDIPEVPNDTDWSTVPDYVLDDAENMVLE